MTTEAVPMELRARQFAIDARPHPFALNPSTSVVLLVDMQNNFGAAGGMFARAGIDISMIRRAVGPTARVLAAARDCGMPIVYLKMAFKPDLSDAGPAALERSDVR